MPGDEFLKLGVRQTASSLRGKMCPKWRQAALWAGNVQEVVRVDGPFIKGPETVVKDPPHDPDCRYCCSLQNGAAFFPDGTTRGYKARSHTTQPNSQWPAACSITRANSPQHEHKNHAAFFTMSRVASRNVLLFQPPSPHSLLSCTFSFISRLTADPDSILLSSL